MNNYYDESRAVLKFVRENPEWNKTHKIYDVFGEVKNSKKFPIWYSDSTKLIFPNMMYSEEKVKEIKNKIDEFISQNNFNLKTEMWESYLEVVHCRGYNIRIKIK